MGPTIEFQRRTWGKEIRETRKTRGLTQEDLAKLWGNTLSYVQKIETGAKGNAETFHDLMALIERQPKRRKAS